MVLPYILAGLVLVDFRRARDLEFSRSNMAFFYISAANGPIATQRNANVSIELKVSNITIGFDLGHDLDFELSRSDMDFAISQPQMIETKRKANILIELLASNVLNWIDLGHNIDFLIVTLTWNFQGQIWILLYLSQK